MKLKEKLTRASNYLLGFPKTKQDKEAEYFFREWMTGEYSERLLSVQKSLQSSDILMKNILNVLYATAFVEYLFNENSTNALCLGVTIGIGEVARYFSDYRRGSRIANEFNLEKKAIEQVQYFD